MSREQRHVEPVAAQGSPDLRADCANCFGLCCVALPFPASADFAIDKEAGRPCPNLDQEFRCGVHRDLRRRGFAGCVAFDCFGAGQKISQHTFGGRDWRGSPEIAGRMFEAFGVMRGLHEVMRYLAEALTLRPARALHGQLRRALEQIEELTYGSPEQLAAVDVAACRAEAGALLARASELARAQARDRRPDRAGADLIGARLARADLRAACLRGALLIGADLSSADLRDADLLGADLRGADLAGADLTGAIFLTGPQVESAQGDSATGLPAHLSRPAHWRDRPAAPAPAPASVGRPRGRGGRTGGRGVRGRR
ncbi:pentapeptide repeat-containing protein [Thermopolyspora sp. NPDC052614]|uniref:pentapeptide repeat-containing protein n=1 Tax=Thermopolyspora sp. NPDC052614 TaxID=3155682 RepID=UPI0034160CC9